jgi:tripartite-type tricarboxylate transporter receptor subunit TctC
MLCKPKFLRGAFAITACAVSVTAFAQEYPSRLVRIVTSAPPGGSSDNYARLIANELQLAWKRSVVVENRSGGTGVIAAQFVKQAAPDGHTLLVAANSQQVLGPLLHDPRPFDPVADFTPVSMMVRFPNYLVINAAIPARTVAEFIAYAKSRPGKLAYASVGQGSNSHLAGEIFNSVTGVEAIHVPYKGATPAQQAVIAGEAQYRFDNVGTSQPFVTAGKLRGLAITGARRLPAVPDVPTMAEAGVRGVEIYTWLGLFGPAALPASVLGKLSAEVTRIMNLPETKKRVLNDGYELVASTPVQFRSDIQAEVVTSTRVIRERGIKAE